MKRRGIWIAILMLAGLAGAASYTLLVNPEINRPLGLDRFDEGAVRSKVLATAQRLLDNPGDLDVQLAQSTDTKTLRKMQELFGFEAANYWAEREVPIQRWTYRIFKPKPMRSLNPFKPEQPTLEAQVASTGRILALSVPPRRDVAPIKLTPEEALATSEKLLRVLGVDVGQITLTSTRSGEEEGRQTFDFGWKQPVKALPGLSYHYGVQLQSGYLTSFERSAVLAEDQPANPWSELFFPLLSGATWFFLALVLLFLLIHKLRRDEMDFRHAQKVGILAGALALVRFGMTASQSVWETILAAALMGILSALFFGALWGASESFLRQMAGEKLRTVDYLLEGRWTVRDTARHQVVIVEPTITISVIIAHHHPGRGG